MNTLRTALTAAVVSALVASGAGYAAVKISGRSIVKHSIPANRLTASAVKTLTAGSAKASDPRALAAAVTSTIDYESTTTEITVSPQTFTVSCPAGDVALGGGYSTSDDVTGGGASENSVTPDFTGWTVTAGNLQIRNDGSTPTLTVYVSCAPSG